MASPVLSRRERGQEANGDARPEAVAKLKEPRSCTDELPADYCQRGRLHLPFGVSYGVAAQRILGKKD
jgi:hypothetical protein